MQKAGIVALVKKRTSDMTLAIGDGNSMPLFCSFPLSSSFLKPMLLNIFQSLLCSGCWVCVRPLVREILELLVLLLVTVH